MGQITATRNLVATKVVRLAGQLSVLHLFCPLTTVEYPVHRSYLNSLAHGRCASHSRCVLFKYLSVNDILSISCEYHMYIFIFRQL